jgi:hypothetical protein
MFNLTRPVSFYSFGIHNLSAYRQLQPTQFNREDATLRSQLFWCAIFSRARI